MVTMLLEDGDHSKLLKEKLIEQLQTGMHCDIEFDVDGQRLRAHRNILSTRCEYFTRVAFTMPSTHLLSVKGVNVETLRSFLTFVYTGSITISSSNVGELLRLSDSFEVAVLRELIGHYVSSNLAVGNLFDARDTAEAYGLPDVLQSVDEFIAQNADQILNSKEALELPFQKFIEFLIYCHGRASQVALMQFAFRWLGYNLKSRSRYRSSILSAFGFEDYPTVVVVEEMPENSVVCNSREGPSSFSQKRLNAFPRPSAVSRKCRKCNFVTKSLISLRSHYKENHDTSYLYECTVCNVKFSFLRQFNNHMKEHFRTTPFPCPVCFVEFEYMKEALSHVVDCHSKTTRIECEACDARFYNLDQLNTHQCPKVGEVVVTVEKDPNVGRPPRRMGMLHCEHEGCEYKTKKRSHFNTHLMTHGNERPYVCLKCNKSFVQRGHLKRHFWTHTVQKPLTCKFCKTYSTARTDKLKSHVRRLHKDVCKRWGELGDRRSSGWIKKHLTVGEDSENHESDKETPPLVVEEEKNTNVEEKLPSPALEEEDEIWKLPISGDDDTMELNEMDEYFQARLADRNALTSSLGVNGDLTNSSERDLPRAMEKGCANIPKRPGSLPPMFGTFDSCDDL